jgi:hypothetical protein
MEMEPRGNVLLQLSLQSAAPTFALGPRMHSDLEDLGAASRRDLPVARRLEEALDRRQ